MSAARPHVWWALCAVLTSSTAGAASGVTITAFAGGGFLLESAERPDAWSSRSLFDFTVGASVTGGFIRPQLLRWSLSGAYQGNRQTANQGAATSLDGLVASARVSALSGTPTPLTFYLTRTNTDVAEITPRRSTGTVVTTGFGATAAVGFLDFPRLTAGVSRNIVETTSADGRRTNSGLTTLDVGVAQQLKRFEYSGSYITNWSNGSYTDLQYGSHNLAVRAAAPLSATAQFSVNDQYFVRLPTTEAPTNPRYEANSVSALLSWRRSERLTANMAYSNLQSSIVAPGSLDQTTTNHALSESLTWRWRDDLTITQQLSAQYAASRRNLDQFHGGRGDFGGGLAWLRPAAWGGTSLGGGATIGVAGDDASLAPGWGANLDAQLSLRSGRLSGSGLYSLVYSDTGTLLFGRTFRQNLRLETIFVPAQSWRLRAFVSGSGARKDNATVGTALQRNLQAVLEAGYREHQLQLFAGYSDGLPESLLNPVIADGLFLPAPYNSQLLNFGATLATAPLRGQLVFRVTGRYTQTAGLGRPTEQEVGVTATASWTIGRFRISAEDRLLLGYRELSWSRNNTLMLRLTRDFDWSF